MLPAGQVNVITQRIDEVTRKYVDAGKSAEHISKSLDYGLRKTFLKGAYAPGELEKGIKSYAETVIKEAGRIKKIKDELAAFVPGIGQKKRAAGSDGYRESGKKRKYRSPEPEEEREKRVKKELEDIETKHMQQLTHLQKLHLEGQIQTDEEYTALQIDLEKKRWMRNWL